MKTAPLAVPFLVLATACQSGPPPEPESRRTPPPAPTQVATQTATAQPTPPPPVPTEKKIVERPAVVVPPAEGDPVKGKFTLDDALHGLTKTGNIYAELKTTKGVLDCELWPQKAPITVANFVGLSRGVRPWKTEGGEWVKKPLYDGTPFHRIIKGFMIQGGDPNGNGTGGPGFMIPDEIWEDAHHNQIGLLCMANRGPNTNGSQFFIMDGVAAHLDGGYTIFGKCGPESVVESLASSEVHGDRAVNPPKLEKVVIRTAKK